MTEAVRVTSKGQATIPVDLREKYGISAPGIVRFIDAGDHIEVRPVPSPDAMMGVLRDAFAGESAAELLRRERAADEGRARRRAR